MQTMQSSYQNMLTSNQKTRQPYDAPLKPPPLQLKKPTKPYELGKNKSQPSTITMAKSLVKKHHNDSLGPRYRPCRRRTKITRLQDIPACRRTTRTTGSVLRGT